MGKNRYPCGSPCFYRHGCAQWRMGGCIAKGGEDMSGMYRNRLKGGRAQKHTRIRGGIQLMSAVFWNGYGAGFAGGKIFTGKTKALCVPVLNCYSCPGALGACPIGALQTVLGGIGGKFPFYVLGLLMLFGVLLGRLVCGFLCPFGFVQDLLYRLPVKKLSVPKKLDIPLRRLKYGILLVFVILLPLFGADAMGVTPPYFCKYICPAGTLEGALPLMLTNQALRVLAGALFRWKLLVMLLVLLAASSVSRFFCRYLCPLGAFYSLFHKFGLYQMEFVKEKCIGCEKCEQVCPMAISVREDSNSPECIRCGKCKAVCPTRAIDAGFAKPKGEENASDKAISPE